jgi:hypothetical protein
MKINDLQMQVMKDTEKSQTNTGVENNDWLRNKRAR